MTSTPRISGEFGSAEVGWRQIPMWSTLDGFDTLDRATSQAEKAVSAVAAAADRLRKTLANQVTDLACLLDGTAEGPP